MTIDLGQQLLEQASSMTYKELSGSSLAAHVFLPDDHDEADRRTAICFFSAGLWDHGLVSQFAPQSLHFRERGAVSLIFETRELSKHRSTPLEAIADAKSAFRWTRLNAEALGIDPNRVVGVGAASGGHLCLASAMVDALDEPSEDASISAAPNALVLFSPIVDTGKKGVGHERFPDPKLATKLSPMGNVRKGLAPMLIFQGEEDRLVPAKQVEQFAKALRRKKNQCELITYAREGHSFFNFNVNMQHFESSVNYMDRFLVDLGFLKEDAGNTTNRLQS